MDRDDGLEACCCIYTEMHGLVGLRADGLEYSQGRPPVGIVGGRVGRAHMLVTLDLATPLDIAVASPG